MEIAKRSLNDIVTYHIWKDRCNALYKGDSTPPMVVANEVWTEFTHTIMARVNHIKSKANWWRYRDEVRLVPNEVATQHLEEIEEEQSILLALLLEWERPVPGKVVDMKTLYSLCPSDSVLRGEPGYNLPPIHFTYDPKWKIRTTPKPTGRGTPDAAQGEVAQPYALQNPSGGGTC